MFDINTIRDQFPILNTRVYNKPLIYLDSAATTQKPLRVLAKIEESYRTANANVHRGVHYLSQEATERHENARKVVARFINAPDPAELLFTRGTTESINLVAFSFGEVFVHDGDEVVISTMEHHSNIVPWQMMCERKGASLKVIKINDRGELDLEHFKSLLNEKTRIVAVTHVSNVLGTINPVKEIIAEAHRHNIPVLIDGAQGIAHASVDVQDLDADFYAFSAHKIYGPTGIGALYGKRSLLDAMPPYQGGGEMISKVTFEHTTYNELPYKFEAGTPDFVGSTAFAEALQFVNEIGLDVIIKHEHDLLTYATDQLLEIPEAKVIGTAPGKAGVLSFAIGDKHPYDIGMLLDRMGVAIRTGHHCAEPLIEHFGYHALARASLGVYNTPEEVDIFISSLKRAVNML
ncbi:cysteine desulfurase [Porphyromonas pogonae]|uniref:aminotransferase class V-fold PLP-dependent enzyme n=1 Tax=Porphyromonas pogonae TaxID=867595 RepID=UPI002E75A70B|nr:cysteine desulfurase [Porphyromonas pogonae]